MKLYPSDKITEFKQTMESVTSTATILHQVILEAAEQHGISLDSISEELGDIFIALFEKFKEQFPPPSEAPSHKSRTVMINTVLDRIEESFLQIAIKLGVSEELLKSHSSSLKFGIQHILVTIGTL